MIDVIKKSIIPILPIQEVTNGFTKYIVAATMEIAQKTIIVKYVLFKVTTCLYVSPSNRARSLSKLTKVIVIKDTAKRTYPMKYADTKT